MNTATVNQLLLLFAENYGFFLVQMGSVYISILAFRRLAKI